MIAARLCPLLAVLLFLTPIAERPAHAEPVAPADLERAKGHFMAGVSDYKSGQFEDALREFQIAYQIAPLPDMLFNLAKTAEQLHHYPDAIGYLEQYLDKRPHAPDRQQIEAEIHRLRELGAGAAPGPGVVAATPGAGTAVPPGLAGPKPARRWPPYPALGLMGGGAVFLIIGAGLGGGALQAQHQLDGMTQYDPALNARGQQLNGAAISFDVLGSVALVAGATWSLVWYLREGRR